MEKSDIITHLSKYVEELSSATRLGTYSIPRLGRSALLGESQSKTTRGNTPWKMAQYVVIPTTRDDKADISQNLQPYLDGWRGLMSSHGNQFLILEVAPGNWQMFDSNGKYMGGNEFIMSYIPEWEDQQKNNQVPSYPLIDKPLQLIYYGAPGTGKSFTIDDWTNSHNSIRTTFHPDSDYASFVRAYKPTMAPMPINAFVGTTVHHAKNADNEKAYEKKIVYKYVPQAFLKAYVEAWKRYSAVEDNPYYLVIEEINRGNCAQIFGDLFQLLDRNNSGCSAYAINADEDIAQFLRDDEKGFGKLTGEQADAIRNFVLRKDSGAEEEVGPEILDGSKLLLPPNLRIWATMNTSDQSLFPIDSAFKRRWNWEYVPIVYDPVNKKNPKEPIRWKLEVCGKTYYWGQFLGFINPKILKLTLSEDKQMGYFFAKPDTGKNGKPDTISQKVFVNKVLFYLWTDVFKDYDLTEEPFVYENEDKTKTPFRFTDFFSTKGDDMLAKFMAGLKLPEIKDENDEDIIFDSEGDEDLNDKKNSNARDYSRYSVNGVGRYSKSQAVVEVFKAMVAANPDASANDILEKVKSLHLSYTPVYSEEQYKYYLEQTTDSRFTKRYTRIELNDGDAIYVYRGSTPQRMSELITGLNDSGSGISLSIVD